MRKRNGLTGQLDRDIGVGDVFEVNAWNARVRNTIILYHALTAASVNTLGDLASLDSDELREKSTVLSHLLTEESANSLIMKARLLIGDVSPPSPVTVLTKAQLEAALAVQVDCAPDGLTLPPDTLRTNRREEILGRPSAATGASWADLGGWTSGAGRASNRS